MRDRCGRRKERDAGKKGDLKHQSVWTNAGAARMEALRLYGAAPRGQTPGEGAETVAQACFSPGGKLGAQRAATRPQSRASGAPPSFSTQSLSRERGSGPRPPKTTAAASANEAGPLRSRDAAPDHRRAPRPLAGRARLTHPRE